jgi:biopolymer transport protein ExbD
VETRDVDCSRVGEELKAMGVPTSREVHIPVEKFAKNDVVFSLLKSLHDAGCANVGFVTGGQ